MLSSLSWRSDKICNPSSEFLVCPKVPSQLAQKISKRHPNQMHQPHQLALWSQIPHPISKVEPSHPTGEARFGIFYPWSHSFGQYPKLVTIGEGWNLDWLVNQKLRPLNQLPLNQDREVTGWYHIKLPVHLTLHNWEGAIHGFTAENHGPISYTHGHF